MFSSDRFFQSLGPLGIGHRKSLATSVAGLSLVSHLGPNWEEHKRATTDVQNGLVFVFLFSFTKALIIRKVLGEMFWKSVKRCGKVWKKVWKSAETILPFSCCPLVFLWQALVYINFKYIGCQTRIPEAEVRKRQKTRKLTVQDREQKRDIKRLHIKIFRSPWSPVLPVWYPDKKIHFSWVPRIAHKTLTPGLPVGRPPGHRRGHRPKRFMFMCLFLS